MKRISFFFSLCFPSKEGKSESRKTASLHEKYAQRLAQDNKLKTNNKKNPTKENREKKPQQKGKGGKPRDMQRQNEKERKSIFRSAGTKAMKKNTHLERLEIFNAQSRSGSGV